MNIIYTTHNVPYIPGPNKVEVVLSDILCPPKLTHTAFVLPMFDDQSFLLAVNQNRGIEIPGGHVDEGETLEQAAVREAFEEVGARVTDLRVLGHLKMTMMGEKPEGYRYPYPISFQQFFTGRISDVIDYEANDECAMPFRCHDLNDRRVTRKTISLFGEAARLIFR
jgi:8-oxo-dGTP pyrophosphatase MutT (NUDIX family)